jgi:hypothetical protein
MISFPFDGGDSGFDFTDSITQRTSPGGMDITIRIDLDPKTKSSLQFPVEA